MTRLLELKQPDHAPEYLCLFIFFVWSLMSGLSDNNNILKKNSLILNEHLKQEVNRIYFVILELIFFLDVISTAVCLE